MDIHIYKQSYVIVTKTIINNRLTYLETQQTLILDANTISTPQHSFNLNDVFDLSYKPFSTKDGLLYLHTNQGMFTYHVKTSPYSFIEEFKRLK